MGTKEAINVVGKSVGFRFLLVSMLPVSIICLFVAGLVISGAPSEVPDVVRVIDKISSLSVIGVISIFILLFIISVITHPLQLSIVRFFEGYWEDAFPLNLIRPRLLAGQAERRSELDKKSKSFKDIGNINESEKQEIFRASWKLQRFFPEEHKLLPMKLGNILRAAEDLPEQRYGLDAVLFWPRLYPLLPRKISTLLDDARTQLDSALRLSIAFGFMSLFSLCMIVKPALTCEGYWWLILPFLMGALSYLSYRSTISSALAYGELIQASFDLYRFQLIRSLHLPLPTSREQEKSYNRDLSLFLRQGYLKRDLVYDHEQGEDLLPTERLNVTVEKEPDED